MTTSAAMRKLRVKSIHTQTQDFPVSCVCARMKLRFAVPLVLFVLAPATAGAKPLNENDFTTVKLSGASSGTEPRITVDKNDDRWVVTNGGGAVVYKSTDGGESFTKSPTKWTQAAATIDVGIVAMDLGEKLPRILASELDEAGLTSPTGYTDDGGKTWHASRGAVPLAAQDRQWFAVGPKNAL